jgi:hypothetical protein
MYALRDVEIQAPTCRSCFLICARVVAPLLLCLPRQAMLNRFWKAKADEAAGPVTKRPYLSSECDSLPECEKWRAQIIREIGRKVAEIQNGARTSTIRIPIFTAHASTANYHLYIFFFSFSFSAFSAVFLSFFSFSLSFLFLDRYAGRAQDSRLERRDQQAHA